MALRLGLEVDFVPGDWRCGADPAAVEAKLAEDREHKIKSVNVVHNETSTGVTSRIAEIRKAIDRTGHPALFMVDTISSLGSIDYRHDEWGVDVTVGCSQKGLMLPPGLGFNAISGKAIAAAKTARLPRSYWAWDEQLAVNKGGFFPSSPATNLLYGLREALRLLMGEGLESIFARHIRHGEATRRAVRAWGVEILCLNPEEYSPVLTTVLMPGEKGADAFREAVLEKFNMSLGSGLGILKDRVFRIGHLGDFNDLSLIGTLGGVEMGFSLAGVPHRTGGVMAAMEYLKAC
jgi:alanine-glyoxylate transaminase/serine-glyoxylate transaminase/serine-pyruvate transaminase